MIIRDKRNVAVDNLRAFLIMCVVAGHLLEILSFRGSRRLYVLLYSFHMPAFVFLSGMCCKLDKNTPKKLLCNYIYPYLIFQTLYISFDRYMLRNNTAYQYTTPYWLLWYFMAMLLWQIMLWLYSGIESKRTAFGISIVLALIAGFDSSIGYYVSLSRTLVLFPYFLAGYYGKEYDFFNDQKWHVKNRKYRNIRIMSILVGILMSVGIIIYAPHINNQMLYHSYSYYPPDFCVVHRIVMMGIAGIWIGILFALIPRKEIPWMTYCGKNTMTVFVLHGFVIRILGKELSKLQLISNCLWFVILVFFIPVVLTLPPVITIIRPLVRLKSRSNR